MATDQFPRLRARDIIDMLLGGASAAEVQAHLPELAAVECQALLCTVCSAEDEMAMVCRERAAEIHAILMANCQFYASGTRACPRSQIVGLEHLGRQAE